jgi:hypothetical protein
VASILFSSNGFPFGGAPPSQPTQIVSTAVLGLAVAQMLPTGQPPAMVTASVYPNPHGYASATSPVAVFPALSRICELQQELIGRVSPSQFSEGFPLVGQITRCQPCRQPFTISSVWQLQTGDPWADAFSLQIEATDATVLDQVSQGLAVQEISSSGRDDLLGQYDTVAIQGASDVTTQVAFVGGAIRVSARSIGSSQLTGPQSESILGIPYASDSGKAPSTIRIVALNQKKGAWTDSSITMVKTAHGVASARISSPGTFTVISVSTKGGG